MAPRVRAAGYPAQAGTYTPRMRRLPVVLAVALAAAALTAPVLPASATTVAEGSRWTMQDRFAREVVRKGDYDSEGHIEHVFELQYRLRWNNVYSGPITGYFGDLTQAAVKRFQKKVGLKVTGVANHATWRQLIPRTVRARSLVPNRCKGPGWNACYDRMRHQVTLWRGGRLWNTWLVRGGDRGMESDPGSYRVYMRDKDHVSGLYGSPMPFSQFYNGGEAFHGSPPMVNPFVDHSHGCINMYVEDARQLWYLTVPKRLDVNVYGAWDRVSAPRR